MRWLVFSSLSAAMLVAVFGASAPAVAKPPPFVVTVKASPSIYNGPCPVTIKYFGEITGNAGDKLSYQIARIVGGVPSLNPWVSAVIPATGKLLVPDAITVTAAQAGIETETIRGVPGPAEATIKVPVTCVNPNATPTPKPNPNATPKPTPSPSGKPLFNPAIVTISPVITPAPSHSPKPPTVNQGVFAPALQKLPPPINLTSRNSRDACLAHGGSAESFACYLALPAGKLVLDWDYPYPNKIDGFNIYSAESAPSGPTTIHMLGVVKPIMTQGDPTLHFEVLEPSRSGACFAVTAFHGGDESDRSVRYCLVPGGVARMVSLQPDRVGSMVEDWFYYVPDGAEKFYTEQPNVRDLLYIMVGVTHVASTWSDSSHTNVTTWTNSRYVGYAHFNTGMLNGSTIAQAKLNLQASGGGETCLAIYGDADHLWNPGDHVGIGHAQLGGSNIMGPNISLDVTPIVQGWASSPGSNTGFALLPEQTELIWKMILLSSSCSTSFPTATLDVTYY